MTADIRHIVFDIGRVLIHYDAELPFSRIIPDPQERAWFFANVCTHEWNVEQDRGRTWQEAEDALTAVYPDHEDSIRAFRKHWHEMVPHAYDGSVAIMKGFIDEGRDVTMLTNFASDTFRQAQEIYPFLNLPRGVTVSGDIGLIKPDPAIYDRHTKDFGLAPSATLFIDDSAANIAAARAYGWNAIQFTGADNLKEELGKYGLLA
jgi:2-haloacid dehalogenase